MAQNRVSDTITHVTLNTINSVHKFVVFEYIDWKSITIVDHKTIPWKKTTPLMVFSVTYYLELHNAITIYYTSHFLPTRVNLVV